MLQPVQANAAVHDCLEHCYRAAHPLDALADWVESAHAEQQWSDDDVHDVETAVRRLLGGIVNKPR
jgi:hypothetical protein